MGFADAVSEVGLEVFAALFLADAPGDQNDGVGPVELYEIVDDPRHLVGPDRHYKEVDLVGQVGNGGHTWHPVDFSRGRMDDMEVFPVKAC